MTSASFQRGMTQLLNDWCDRSAIAPSRIVLPHFPLPNGFSDEVLELSVALKTVRAQLGSTLPPGELDRVISLLHEVEVSLGRKS